MLMTFYQKVKYLRNFFIKSFQRFDAQTAEAPFFALPAGGPVYTDFGETLALKAASHYR
jgi:hypothetical protein